jgi:tetratricopeptide (TPR) repeat protein
MENLEKAIFYYKARLTLNQSKESWSNYAILAKKTGKLKDCEESINNCIEIEPDDINYKILYAAIKWIKGRPTDAIHFLLAIIDEMKGIKNTNCNLAFLFKDTFILSKDKYKELLFKKHWEAALRFKLKDSGNTQYLGKSKINL